MPAPFSLRVVTQDRTVFSGQVTSLVAPGVEGYLGVMAHHAPMLTGLAPGELHFVITEGDTKVYAISGGFLQVAGNEAVVLVDSAESPEEIDIERARQAVARAEQRLHAPPTGTDVDRARAALMRALNRLRVAERYRH